MVQRVAATACAVGSSRDERTPSTPNCKRFTVLPCSDCLATTKTKRATLYESNTKYTPPASCLAWLGLSDMFCRTVPAPVSPCCIHTARFNLTSVAPSRALNIITPVPAQIWAHKKRVHFSEHEWATKSSMRDEDKSSRRRLARTRCGCAESSSGGTQQAEMGAYSHLGTRLWR